MVIQEVDFPRMPREGKEWMQFTPETRVSDRFIFEDHTILRIYGFEGKPYKLHMLLTVRIVAMEYTRRRLLLYELHFGSVKQPKYFHIPKDVGPFQIRYLKLYIS